MKNKILTAIAVMASLCGYAQTKGTNALSLGVDVRTEKLEQQTPDNEYNQESKTNNYQLGYSFFIKDNAKLGINLLYNRYESKAGEFSTKQDGYGGDVNYQHYYPIVKKLFVYAGGRAGYLYTETEYLNGNSQSLTGHHYKLGAYGGVTWFFSKRFALETSLLSANIDYATTKRKSNQDGYGVNVRSTNFNLSSQGFLNNLGFKIYLLF